MTAFRTVAETLAGRYVGLATPAGAKAIRSSSAATPNAIGATPCVIVSPDAGVLERPTGGSRLSGVDWFVRLYYGQLAGEDLDRDSLELLDWLTVLVDVLGTDLDLGASVVAARTMGWRAGVLRYAGVTFSGVELRVHTTIAEPWTPTQ